MEQNKRNPPITDQIKEYFETRIRLMKYKAIDQATGISASVIAYAIVAVIGLIAVFFLSITLALLLGVIIGSYWIGFACVTLLYIIVAVLVFVLKAKYIETPLIAFFISKLFKNNTK